MSNRLIIIGIVILSLGVAALAFLVLSSGFQQSTPLNPQPNQSQQQQQLPIQQEGPCKDFETLEQAQYPTSCQMAVDIALDEAPGTIENISIENVISSIESPDGNLEIREVEMWLVNIRLDTPYFDESLNKNVSLVQVGTPTQNQSVMRKKILQ